MLQADEFDLLTIWGQEERDQYAEMESAIDAGLKQKGEVTIKIKSDDFHKVVRLIVHRYRKSGWAINDGKPTEDGLGTLIITHPHLIAVK
jgi:hypothetical protein